jgi:hypothetical protein
VRAKEKKDKDKKQSTTSAYIEAAASERQLVVLGTFCGSIEQVSANASGVMLAARTSTKLRTIGPGISVSKVKP